MTDPAFDSPFAAFVWFWFAGVVFHLGLYLVFVTLSALRWFGDW